MNNATIYASRVEKNRTHLQVARFKYKVQTELKEGKKALETASIEGGLSVFYGRKMA